MNILVTGGNSGVGEAIVRELAGGAAHRVFFTHFQAFEKAALMEAELPMTLGIPCDFTDQNSLNTVLNKIPELDLDVLINNAFTRVEQTHFHRLDPGTIRQCFEHNVLSTLMITQQAITGFRKRKFGKIITIISSAVVNKPPIGWSAYVASKAYLLSMSKSWAVENARFNISANCISPSFMATPYTSGTDDRVIEEMIANHPLHRLLTPEEVARAVRFLVETTQQINGVNLLLNAASDVV